MYSLRSRGAVPRLTLVAALAWLLAASSAIAVAGGGAHFVGKVTETMDSGGYTYVHLQGEKESLWAAGPETVVAVGAEVGIHRDMPMPNFHSDTLDRTFDILYFVGGFEIEGAEAVPADPHAGIPGFPKKDKKAESDVGPVSVERAEGGFQIAEVWAQRADMAGEQVTVRGKVVKYNGGILGVNWLHLQDGSGDEEAGDNDLTVTSASTAQVGDIVTVTGTVVLDKDFGAGYRYAVLLEEAAVAVE